MKVLLITLFALSSCILSAQIFVEWNGGTPGKMNVWEEANNWSNYRVPDESTHILIKHKNSGHNAQPVLNSKIKVGSIAIASGMTLTINKNAEITIDGKENFTYGLICYGGSILNNGSINLANIDPCPKAFKLDRIYGVGFIFVDGILKNPGYSIQ